MFPAEGLWGWLKLNARNKFLPEATMMGAYRDRQWYEHYMLQFIGNIDAPPYYYTEEFIADPSKITMTPLNSIGKKNAVHIFEPLELKAVVRFYLQAIPVLASMWAEAVSHFYTTHSVAQCSALGLVDDEEGLGFVTDLDLIAFYDDHFSGGCRLLKFSNIRGGQAEDERSMCYISRGVTLKASAVNPNINIRADNHHHVVHIDGL